MVRPPTPLQSRARRRINHGDATVQQKPYPARRNIDTSSSMKNAVIRSTNACLKPFCEVVSKAA